MIDLENKIIKNNLELDSQVVTWKSEMRKIVFTNGCFDILHFGHIKLLYESKKMGDKLIVGLNTDESIRNIKGKNRPINNNNNRSIMLASLSFVDRIIFFSEPTPIDLIKRISPNILTKGSDYNMEDVIGYQEVINLGGVVKIIQCVSGLSSTSLIEN